MPKIDADDLSAMRRDVQEARQFQQRYVVGLGLPAPASFVHSQMSCILPVLDRLIEAVERLSEQS